MANCEGCGCKDGQRGPIGLQGIQGIQGIQGVAGANGSQGPNGLTGSQGPNGPPGSSAYQVWLSEGNVGTEAVFLNSLIGPTGTVGPAGPAGGIGLNGTNGIPGLPGATGPAGANGDSAYDVWLSLGNTGSETDFINDIIANAISFTDWTDLLTLNGWLSVAPPSFLGYLQFCQQGKLTIVRGLIRKIVPPGGASVDLISILPVGAIPSVATPFFINFSYAITTSSNGTTNGLSTARISNVGALTIDLITTVPGEVVTVNFNATYRAEL